VSAVAAAFAVAFAVAVAAAFASACGSPAPQKAPSAAVASAAPACPSNAVAPPAVTVSAPADAGAAAVSRADDATASRDESNEADRARFFPGADEAGSPRDRSRKKTAVLLFAPPVQHRMEEQGLSQLDTLSFQPVVCAIGGKLFTGVKCGEAMPARAKVRLTSGGLASEMELHRSTTAFRDDASGRVFQPPYAPACCMYNTCVGQTVPYLPSERSSVALYTTKTLLAVWPPDAEIDLQPLGADTFDASAPPPYSRAAGASLGARAFYVLSKSDVDGDGRHELVVFEHYANDYGLAVLPAENQPPLYRFSCGNI
jgi:hypothetical protein